MKTKIFALSLAIAMLLCTLVSCGGGDSTGNDFITVELLVEAEEETIVTGPVRVYYDAAAGEKPTILMAVTQALDELNKSYKVNGGTISSILNYSEVGNYYWDFTLNGQEAKTGFSVQEIKEGDNIVVFYATFEDEL